MDQTRDVPDEDVITVRATGAHGYTKADEDSCVKILDTDAVDRWVTLLSFPGSIVAWLKPDTTNSDAERIVERLREIPHLANVSIKTDKRTSDQEPRPRVVAMLDREKDSAPPKH